ncbi:hypothetical protein FQZ97_969020 [compost metagenome]
MGDHIARQVRAQSEVDFKTFVAPALVEINAAARRAERHLGFTDLDFTAEMIDQAENSLRTFLVYDREPMGDEPGLSGSSSQLGTVITRPEQAEAEVKAVPSPQAAPAEIPPRAEKSAPARRIPRSRR